MKKIILFLIVSLAVFGVLRAEENQEELQWMFSAFGGGESFPLLGLSLTEGVGPNDRIPTDARISEAHILVHKDYASSIDSLRPRDTTSTATPSSTMAVSDEAMVAGTAVSSVEAKRSMEPFTVPDSGIASYGPNTGHQGWWCLSGWTLYPSDDPSKWRAICGDKKGVEFQ